MPLLVLFIVFFAIVIGYFFVAINFMMNEEFDDYPDREAQNLSLDDESFTDLEDFNE